MRQSRIYIVRCRGGISTVRRRTRDLSRPPATSRGASDVHPYKGNTFFMTESVYGNKEPWHGRLGTGTDFPEMFPMDFRRLGTGEAI